MDWITTFNALKSVYIDGAFSNIAINEAIELAKKYCAEDSPSFINGVLAKLV